MRRPKDLSGEEAALWARVAATVKPMRFKVAPSSSGEGQRDLADFLPSRSGVGPYAQTRSGDHPTAPAPTPPLKGRGLAGYPPALNTLDSTWDRRLGKGELVPDFTLDLHGHSLDAAWSRLEHGLSLAQQQGARLVLIVTGRPRPVEAADRGRQRGAIRAKLMDWLASGSHASRIAAVRGAHPRHGGAGAVYVVLKRVR